MRKTHNLSSHHHPWEIQFVPVPLAPVRTTRVIATWYSLEHVVNSVLMCVASVFFVVVFSFLCCILCHSSFIFLVIIRVIQCVGKVECLYWRGVCSSLYVCRESSMKCYYTVSTNLHIQKLGFPYRFCLVHLKHVTISYLQFLLCATIIRFDRGSFWLLYNTKEGNSS